MDTNNSSATVSFNSFGKKVSLHSGEGEIELKCNGDNYSFELESSRGVMITFD
jgi:spore coat protein U-like protein